MPSFSSLSRGDKKPAGTSKINGAKMLWALAAVFAIAVGYLLFSLAVKMTSTSTYYVLNSEVKARSQVTADLLTPVVVSEGGAPANAIDIGDVQTGSVFAKYTLNPGDILTASNTGPMTPLTADIPSDYVVASFSSPVDRAVAGKLNRGDRIDIISVFGDEATSERVAKYILRNVSVVDVSIDLEAADLSEQEVSYDEDGNEISVPESSASRRGVPAMYTVALPAADAAKLALLTPETTFVVLSPKNSVEKGAGEQYIAQDLTTMFGTDLVGDSSPLPTVEGTEEAPVSEGTPAGTPDSSDAPVGDEVAGTPESPASDGSTTGTETPVQ